MKYVLSQKEYDELTRDAEMWRKYPEKSKNELMMQTFAEMDEWSNKRFPEILADTALGIKVRGFQSGDHIYKASDDYFIYSNRDRTGRGATPELAFADSEAQQEGVKG